MKHSEKLNDTKEAEDIKVLIEKYFKLQDQINTPTRLGMIEALSDAQSIAHDEISALEKSQGAISPTSWSSFSDYDLYRKLAQYTQGLRNHAAKKIGESTFKHLLEEYIKTHQSQ